jgi:hypothetical protein
MKNVREVYKGQEKQQKTKFCPSSTIQYYFSTDLASRTENKT